MSQPKKRARKYRGLFARGGIWYVHFELDKKSYRYSTGIPVSGPAPPDVQALVPRGREQKERAVKELGSRKARTAEGPTGLRAYAAEFLERKPQPSDIKNRTLLIHTMTKFFPKGADLTHITRSAALRYHQHIAELVGEKKITFSGRYGNMHIQRAHRLFDQAIQDERIPGLNPFRDLCKGKYKFPEKKREYVLTRQDEPILLKYCAPWLKAMIVDDLFLGFRAGEARGLKRADFRPNEGAHGYIVLDVTQTKGYRLAVAQGRSPDATPARIALTAEVRDRMRSRLTSIRHEFFYSGPRGGPVHKDTLEKAIRRAWKKAEPELAKLRGIPLAEFREEMKAKGGFVFHSLRHTAATRAGEAGFSEREIMQKFRMGPEVVKQYVHGSDEWSEMAARKMAEAEG